MAFVGNSILAFVDNLIFHSILSFVNNSILMFAVNLIFDTCVYISILTFVVNLIIDIRVSVSILTFAIILLLIFLNSNSKFILKAMLGVGFFFYSVFMFVGYLFFYIC